MEPNTSTIRSGHSAAIFDMDGVLLDSGPIHMAAWVRVLGELGYDAESDGFRERFGMRDTEVVPRLMGTLDDDKLDEVLRHKSQYFQELVRAEGRPVAGVVEYITELHNRGIHAALASLATTEEIETVLDALQLTELLNVVVTRDQKMRDKPAPDIYLTAVYRLEVEPHASVVFEDAVSGVEAARKAGATTVAVTTSHDRGMLSHADLIVDDFTEPSLRALF